MSKSKPGTPHNELSHTTIASTLPALYLDFFQIFHRYPTYKEVADWTEFIGGTVSKQTHRAALRKIHQKEAQK